MSWQVEEVASPVDDTGNLDAAVHGSVKHDVGCDRKVSEAGPDIRASYTQSWVPRQHLADLFNSVQQAIRGRKIVLRHVAPDLDQVLSRSTAAEQARHLFSVG
jgi:hypothetical protein